MVARAVPDHLRGSGFGALGGIQAAGDVVSSVAVAILYTSASPAVAFTYAAAWMALSVTGSAWLVSTGPGSTAPASL